MVEGIGCICEKHKECREMRERKREVRQSLARRLDEGSQSRGMKADDNASGSWACLSLGNALTPFLLCVCSSRGVSYLPESTCLPSLFLRSLDERKETRRHEILRQIFVSSPFLMNTPLKQTISISLPLHLSTYVSLYLVRMSTSIYVYLHMSTCVDTCTNH